MDARHGQDPDLACNFTTVPTSLAAYVEAKKISDRAAWLYVVMLGYRNQRRSDDYVWPTRKTLAAKCGLSQAKGVDRFLKELQDAGLILTEQRRNEDGAQLSSRHKLLLTRDQQGGPQEREGGSPGEGWGGTQERDGGVSLTEGGGYPLDRGGRSPGEGYELEELELEELKTLSSEALAPLVASDAGLNPQERKSASTTDGGLDRQDMNLFIRLVGEDVLYDDSAVLMEDYLTIHWVYDWLRERGDQAVLAPGKHVKEIHSAGGDDAVSDWLADLGLNRLEWFEPGELAA